MSNNRLSIRMDAELKSEAEQVFSQLGMNLTTAVNIFFRQSVRDGGLPFKPSALNPETAQALNDVQDGNVESFGSVDEWIASHE